MILRQGGGKGEGDSCWLLAPTFGKPVLGVGAAHFPGCRTADILLIR